MVARETHLSAYPGWDGEGFKNLSKRFSADETSLLKSEISLTGTVKPNLLCNANKSNQSKNKSHCPLPTRGIEGLRDYLRKGTGKSMKDEALKTFHSLQGRDDLGTKVERAQLAIKFCECRDNLFDDGLTPEGIFNQALGQAISTLQARSGMNSTNLRLDKDDLVPGSTIKQEHERELSPAEMADATKNSMDSRVVIKNAASSVPRKLVNQVISLLSPTYDELETSRQSGIKNVRGDKLID